VILIFLRYLDPDFSSARLNAKFPVLDEDVCHSDKTITFIQKQITNAISPFFSPIPHAMPYPCKNVPKTMQNAICVSSQLFVLCFRKGISAICQFIYSPSLFSPSLISHLSSTPKPLILSRHIKLLPRRSRRALRVRHAIRRLR
jgi:hypothetical protein